MGLFGITLKKLEAIPGDIVHGVEGMFHGGPAPGGGQNPQANNQGVYQSPASQAASAVRPTPVAPPPAANPALNAPPSATPDNAPHDGDVIGLRKALNGLGAYSQDDQARIINRASKAGLIAHNVAAATQDQILSPNLPTDRSPVGQLAQAGEDVLLPGASNLAKQVGTNLASNSLLDKSLSGQYDPSTVNNTLNEANANNGGIVDNLKGVNYAKLADASAQGALGIAGALTAPEVGAFATRNAGRVEAAVNQGKDYLQSLKLFDPVNDHISQNPFLGQTEPIQPQAAAGGVPAKAYNITPKADSSLQVGRALPQSTADAAHTVSALYNEDPEKVEVGKGLLKDAAARGHQLINVAIGRGRRFSEAGDQLDQAIASDYTPEEIQAARDNLEGVGMKPNARVQALSDTMKQLNEQGYNVLDQASDAKDPLHRVLNYATRAAETGANPNAVEGNPAQRAMSSIQDIFSAKSGFANNRVIQKFVAPNGDVQFGTQTELGLTKKGNALVDSSGTKWTPRATSTTELNANGYDYKDLNAATNQYHSSVGRVKAAQDAKAELLRDPEHYGLINGTPSRDLLRQYVPVKGIPELNGYYAPRHVAGGIADTFDHPYVPSVAERAFQGISTGAIQSIVYNALFHTRNLNELAGLAAGKIKGLSGGAEYKKALFDTLKMPDIEKAAIDDRMNVRGVVRETYGADHQTVLSDALDKAGLPHINKASPTLMGNIDWSMRRALFHLVTTGEGAISDDEAAALVNKFMGDRQTSSFLSRNFGLFWHYMKTRVNVVAEAIRHPNENQGTILMAAEQAAVLYGTTKAFQEWTGNQHASLGAPGIFGLIKKGDEVAHGQVAGAVTSSINPVVTAAGNQLYGKDLYTGQDLDTPKARLANLEHTIIAPTQNTSKVADGKASIGQEALQMGLGVNLPHVKGAPAVPNAKNPLANIINMKGAKAVADEKDAQGHVAIHDLTGLDQAKLFYDAKAKALGAVRGDKLATDSINAYLDDNINSKGQSVKKDPSQTMGVAGLLAGSPAALRAMKKMQQASPSHDPMWDLSDADLKTFLQARANSDSSGVMEADKIGDTQFNKGEGFQKFVDRRDAYYKDNKFPAGSAIDNPETPKYPNFQGEQQTEYNLYKQQYENSPDAKAKAQFIQSHPLVGEAIKQVSDYFNNQAYAQTGNHLKQANLLTPEQQTWYNWYNSLPSKTGARSAAIKGNPEMWSAISNSLAQSDLVHLAEAGAVNQYANVPFQQNFLKDAYNAGKYDISSGVPLPGGGSGFAVKETTPQTIASGSDSSSGKAKFARSSASSKTAYARLKAQVKSDSQARDMEHAAKAADSSIRRVNKINKIHGPKRLSIHMRGETSVQPFKVKGATLKARQINKVAAKPVKALNRGNRATLKA